MTLTAGWVSAVGLVLVATMTTTVGWVTAVAVTGRPRWSKRWEIRGLNWGCDGMSCGL
jgi:hypothetical protein